MLAVHGAVETFAQEKISVGALLAQLHAHTLLELLQLIGGKTRLQQDLESDAEPAVEVIA